MCAHTTAFYPVQMKNIQKEGTTSKQMTKKTNKLFINQINKVKKEKEKKKQSQSTGTMHTASVTATVNDEMQ